jgi:hypothetical protein
METRSRTGRRQVVEDLQNEVGIRLNRVIESYAAAEMAPASDAEPDPFVARQVRTVEGMRAIIHVEHRHCDPPEAGQRQS